MATLWQAATRQQLLDRSRRLSPDARARWGRFSCPQMLAHVNDALRMALGELPTVSKRLPLRYPPLKQLIICVLPFPKGAPTAPELLARVDTAVWAQELAAFEALLDRFAVVPENARRAEHPAFGRMSRRAWGVLGYRHVDHHFAQFGV